jgi:predicted ATPase
MRGYGTPPATATPLEAYTRLVKDGRLAPDEGQTVVMKKLQVMTPEQRIVSHETSVETEARLVVCVRQIGRP